MALKSWLWNLGTAGMVVAAGGCDTTIAGGDTDGGTTGETDPATDTEVETTPTSDTESGPTLPSGTSSYGTSNYGTSYYGTSYYGTSYGTDTDGDPECEVDEDCELGVCIDAGKQWSYCEPLPIPGACDGEVEVALTWVREGEGAGTSAGLAGDDRVVLLEATLDEVVVPVSLAPIEAGATPEPLPVTLTKGDIIVGAAGADLDGDGDEDVLLSVQDDVRLRVVAMLQEDDATFVEGETVSFETQGDAAQVRRFGDGSFELVSRLDSGLLFVASGLGDGSFAAPVLSTWATEPLSAFAVGALDASVDDDLAVAVAGPGGESTIEVLIDGGQLPVGALGSDARSLHMDARTGWMITVLDTGRAPLEFGRLQLGVDVDVNTLLLLDEEGATLGSTVSDIDGDGRSEVIALHEDGHLTVVFAASTGGACTQIVETGAVFDTIHRPSSGERQGVVLSGADGVLAVRGPAAD